MAFPVILSLGLLLFQGGVQPSETRQIQQSLRSSFPQAAELRARGEFRESYEALLEPLSISRRNDLHGYKGKCLVRMGLLKWDLGNVAESQSHFDEALTAFKESNDSRSQEFCAKCLRLIQLYNLGKEDRKAKLYHRSLERFEEARLLGRETGFQDFELKCLRQQGLTYLDMRNLEPFLENSRKGLVISARINHRVEQGRCLDNTGVYYQQRSDYSQAVTYFENALSVIKTVDDEATEAECLSNLGITYRELGNMVQAQFYLSRALELDKKMGDAHAISIDLINIGSVSLRKGIDNKNEDDLLQALEAFQDCLLVQERGEADPLICFAALNNMGISLNEQKNHGAARRQFGRAMRIVEREKHVLQRCHVLVNIAASYLDEQNVDEALAHYQQSYELSAKYSFENLLRESCFGLGQCYERKRENDAALSFYRKAIEFTEEMRDRISSEPFIIGFARNKSEAYQRAIRILAGQYAVQHSPELLEEIFDLVERAKARAFLESIHEARVDLAEWESSSLKERQQVISKNIFRLSRELASPAFTGEKRHALKSELELEEGEYIRLISEMKVSKRNPKDIFRREICRIQDVQRQVLSRKAVLLEYLLGEQQSYLIRVSPESAKLYILPARERIERSLRGYLKLISDRTLDPRTGIEAAERIGREIIPLGVDESIRNAKALIVIPDRILHYLPFEALRVQDEKGSRFLVERKVISYCPSATALAVLKDPRDHGTWTKDLLAVGGPIYGQKRARDDRRLHQREERRRTIYQEEGVDLSPLPFSKKEVTSIAKLFSRNAVDILIGKDANEEALKKLPLRDYRIIHFACHGFLNERYPFRSALVLSPSGGPDDDDGFLQMREIYGLTMNAALVVLSACQTGKGLLERSEGPLGLARPFFFAGARAVISSLWPINDEASVNFMSEFYEHLIRGHSAGEALRFAKERMLASRWSHPFYWAGFVLQGDPSAAGKADLGDEALLSRGW